MKGNKFVIGALLDSMILNLGKSVFLSLSEESDPFSIIENGQNTKKSPGDLRRLAVTQTPVKNHRLTLM